MRLYFAQSGLTMHSLHFKRLAGDFDVAAIAETEA